MSTESKADAPLTPIYNNYKPPWLGCFSRRRREYNGRKEYWGEAGYKDEVVQAGRWRMFPSRYLEEDPDWYDKKVEDGTSMVGMFGLDSTKYPDFSKKGDTPGSLKEFQDHIFKNSLQYKQIAKKWQLSDEHPGFSISPTLDTLYYTHKGWLGRSGIPNSWFHLGPQFFRKPINEGTFEKGLACAKYTAIFMLPYTLFDIKAFETVKREVLTPKTFLKRYMQLVPIPVALAFTWGVAISLSANIRRKDDLYNHLYASTTAGTVLGLMQRNTARGLFLGAILLFLGTVWQYSRVQQHGLQGRQIIQETGGWWGGPTVWKLLNRGDIEVPTEKY
uniref:HIG1 domain-containing protein n=1 Tax=Syphacia muris TaxID=451379 RepID=A0A0N5B0R1_9BILA